MNPGRPTDPCDALPAAFSCSARDVTATVRGGVRDVGAELLGHDVIYIERREIGAPLDRSDRRAADLDLARQRPAKADYYYKNTRREFHVSRGRVALGRLESFFLPQWPKSTTRAGRATVGHEPFSPMNFYRLRPGAV